MSSLFISHSHEDRAVAERVAARLRAEGFAALFLDVDPAQGIPAGRHWERELYAALRRTDAVIFLRTDASVASRWCFAEIALSRSLGKPIFPLRVTPGAPLSLLNDVQEVDLAEGEGAFSRLWAGLRRAGLDPHDSFAWDPTRSPYPGLAAFAAEDAAVFFGRHQEIIRLLELVQPTLSRAAGRWVGIIGPSGSGKSSLLRAGLLPRLTRLSERWVLVPPMLPGARPLHELAVSLANAFALQGRRRTASELEQRLSSEPGGLALQEVVAELSEAAGDATNVLVSIDQAEELLIRTGQRDQQAFLRLMDGALHEDSPLWVVSTLRSEFLSTAPERAGLTEVIDDPLIVEPVSRARLPEVICSPARRAGLEFEPGLVERMVEDTTGGDALPLLAYTLHVLANRAGAEGRIATADYEAIGGVIGALQRRANQLVEELSRRGHGPLILPTLLRLATVDEYGLPVRRRLPRAALSSEEQLVVDAFVDARLLTTTRMRDEAGLQAKDQAATVDVAHEALLRTWPPLRQAIEASRAALRMRAELERDAEDWRRDKGDPGELYRGRRLADALEWTAQYGFDLGESAQAFLKAARWRRALRRTAAGLAAAAALAGVARLGTPELQELRWRNEARELGPAVRLPAGKALVGPSYRQKSVKLPALLVDVHEVTNRQYRLCVRVRWSAPGEPFNRALYATGDPDLPVVHVTAHQAAGFCAWLGKRLPAEAEWERAARGLAGRRYPWGSAEPTPAHVNAGLADMSPSLVPVNQPGFEMGETPEGIQHLIGNAGEWTATRMSYADDTSDRTKPEGEWNGRDPVPGLAVKGGDKDEAVPADAASPTDATHAAEDIGFRCVTRDE